MVRKIMLLLRILFDFSISFEDNLSVFEGVSTATNLTSDSWVNFFPASFLRVTGGSFVTFCFRGLLLLIDFFPVFFLGVTGRSLLSFFFPRGPLLLIVLSLANGCLSFFFVDYYLVSCLMVSLLMVWFHPFFLSRVRRW